MAKEADGWHQWVSFAGWGAIAVKISLFCVCNHNSNADFNC